MKTRARELAKARECIGAGKDLVIDNTNVRRQDRAPWIALARAAGYRVTGYFFRLEMRAAIKRNSLRTGKDVIPVPALIKLWKQMEEPSTVEGFDELWTVTVPEGELFSPLGDLIQASAEVGSLRPADSLQRVDYLPVTADICWNGTRLRRDKRNSLRTGKEVIPVPALILEETFIGRT